MKTIIILIVMTFSLQSVEAQTKKVREKDIIGGLWQMKIEMREGFLDEEIDEEDNIFARMIIQATGNLVEGVVGNIDIKFEFMRDGRCKIYAEAFGSDADIDYSEWYINSRGELFIEDSDSYNSDGDDFWLFEDDVLVLRDSYGKMDEDANVYMVRID